jgi:hypothetical protein
VAVRQSLNAAQKADYEKVRKGLAQYTCTVQYVACLLKGSYIDLADTLPWSYAVLLLQLRTGYIPLAKHLHRICKANSPICPCCCQADNSVAHYLLHCPEHLRAHQVLYSAAGPDTHILHKLLGDPKLLPHLFRYLNRTGRFHSVHSTLPAMPDPQPNCLLCGEFFAALNLCMPTTHLHTADPFNNMVSLPGFLEDWAVLQADLRANPPPPSPPN